jgi:DNA-binding transcriptional LysR family regulator
MELRQLRYFLAVAQELQFTRASKVRHVAQPALSQQIRLLEGEIGTWLFGRTNRRVRLKPAGRISIGAGSGNRCRRSTWDFMNLNRRRNSLAIESGGLDMGMRHASEENTELASVVVSREQLVVALLEQHPALLKARFLRVPLHLERMAYLAETPE